MAPARRPWDSGVAGSILVSDFAPRVHCLGWGRWTSGSVSDHNVAFDLSAWRSGMPYLVGRPTLDANLPVSGTMTYALAGATKAVDMTTGAVGTLSGALSIAFQNGQYNVTPNLNIAMPGQTYVTGSGITRVGPGGARGTFTTMTQNVTGGACAGSACTFSTQGMLTGAAANNARIVFADGTGDASDRCSGVQALMMGEAIEACGASETVAPLDMLSVRL